MLPCFSLPPHWRRYRQVRRYVNALQRIGRTDLAARLLHREHGFAVLYRADCSAQLAYCDPSRLLYWVRAVEDVTRLIEAYEREIRRFY